MNDHSKTKYFILLLVLLIAGLAYYLYAVNEKPIVTTPESYPEGTTLSTYKKIPPGFPSGVIAEEYETLDHSSTVALPTGKTQTTVSYVSKKSVIDVSDITLEALRSKGWNIVSSSITGGLTTAEATQGDSSIMLTIAPVEGGTLVTFQLEK